MPDMPLPPPPAVNAKAYVLVEYGSGQVLAGQGVDERIEPASLTKLMTAYVVFAALKEGRLKLTDPVTISEHAWRSEGSRTFIKVGTQVPVEVLLKGMIVQSGNDASIALAEHVGGTEAAFVDIMNAYAQRLGMTNTHFEDASGMPSPNHYSTARDLATLSRALIRDFPEYYGLFSLREYTWNNIRQQNRNGLLDRDPTVDGIKTGHTETAGYCLISSARRQGARYITVVLDTPELQGARGRQRRRCSTTASTSSRRSRIRKARRDDPQATRLQGHRQLPRGRRARGRAGERAARPGRQRHDARHPAPAAARAGQRQHAGGRAAHQCRRPAGAARAAVRAQGDAAGRPVEPAVRHRRALVRIGRDA